MGRRYIPQGAPAVLYGPAALDDLASLLQAEASAMISRRAILDAMSPTL